MRIFVYGAGKTGTTAVYYAYLNAVPGLKYFFEPRDLSKIDIPAHPNLLVKSLAVMNHAQDAPLFAHFDKKILIVRHPFDRLVSYVLYAPNNGRRFFDDRNMAAYIELLKKKLSSPHTISFRQIFEMAASNLSRAAGVHAPVKALEAIADAHPDFHLLRYEDFVDGKLEDINRYNGFEISSDPEISDNNQKVVRSKDYGDWHKWFLPEDVEYFHEVYNGYLHRFGYDAALQKAEPLDEATTIRYSIKVANQGRRVRWLAEYVPGQINMTTEGIRYQLAKHALMHGQMVRAQQLIDEAISSNPRVAGFHHLRSEILLRQADNAGAADAVRQALAIFPEEPKFHRLLEVALQRMRRKANAGSRVTSARAWRF